MLIKCTAYAHADKAHCTCADFNTGRNMTLFYTIRPLLTLARRASYLEYPVNTLRKEDYSYRSYNYLKQTRDLQLAQMQHT
jgi:hypothetical protein